MNDMHDSKVRGSHAAPRLMAPAAESHAIRGETSMNGFMRLFQAGLLLLALAATAAAQMHAPYGDGGAMGYGGQVYGAGAGYYGGYGASSGAGMAHVPLLGRTMFSVNGAIDGLGYEGSYVSMSTTAPLGNDSLYGWWLFDGRASISQNGGFFTNLGLVRRTHFTPMNADFGFGLFYDIDADQYEDFGHTFHQVGVSANIWTPNFDVNVNGYIPLGPSDQTVGHPGTCFYENYILLQHGLDAALEGFEVDFGIRPPSMQQKNGTINLGVYSYQSDSVDPFAGFQGSYSFQPNPGMRLSVGMTADDQFNPSGLFQLEIWRGRSRGYSPSGRGLDPVRRRAHIVRAHEQPIFLTDPDTDERIRVVHVDNSAPDGGDGKYESPYNELEDADGTLPPYVEVGMATDIPRSLPGDIIFVHTGLSRMDFGALTPDDPSDDTPLDPTDDLPGDLTGYDQGITLLDRQQLLGDGVQHIIETNEDGNYLLCNNILGFTPFISNPDGAAVTLADDTTVRGFNIVNSKIGILAPDPTPLMNNGDGVSGDILIEDVNILANDPIFLAADFNQNTGDAVDPHLATFRIPLDIGIDILDSTASFVIDDVDIDGLDMLLSSRLIDPAGLGFVVVPIVEGEMVAAINIERGNPIIKYTGMIDDEFDVQTELILDDGDPNTVDPTVLVELGMLQAGGSAVRIMDTTAGTDITINGMINNVTGEGIMVNNADDSMITFNAAAVINDSVIAAVNVMNSDNSLVNFANDLMIIDPAEAGVLLTDNMDSDIRFFDLSVTTPANQAALDAGNPLVDDPVAGFVARRNGGSTITVAGNSSLNIVGGPALVVSAADGTTTALNMNWTSLLSTSSHDGGIDLANVSGTFKSNVTEVTDSAGPAIKVAGVDVDMLDANFGQVIIAPSDPATTTQGPGVVLRENPNATFTFVTLDVTTTDGLGFQAINSGTVNFVTPAIIDATGGAAVDIENTAGETNGLVGWTFERVSSTDSSDEGVRLVDLTTDFQVRGDTTITDSSGFAIDVSGGDAVDIDFNEVNIVNRHNVGVQVDGVAGTVRFANVDMNGGDGAGNAVNIIDTFATGGHVQLLGGTITDAQVDGVYIENSIATVTNMTINEVDGAFSDDGIQVVTTGTGSSVVLLADNVINLPAGDNGVRVIANGTGTLNITINNNVLNTQPQVAGETLGGLHATVESGTLNLSADSNSDGAGLAPTDDFFLEQLGGTFNVTEASAGDFSSLNNNVNVVTFGVITFGAANPALPPPITP